MRIVLSPFGRGGCVFAPNDYGRMALVADDELGALADRVVLELPRIVERIRMIDFPVQDPFVGEQVAA